MIGEPVRIVSLSQHGDLVPQVARWHFDEWGHADPGGSAMAWAAQLRERCGEAGVPSYWVAFADGEPVGSVGLCENDMTTHPELAPWLSGLYVLPGFRRRGIGRALVGHAMDVARAARIDTLFLHTARAEPLYSALGWQTLSREPYEGEQVCLMSARLVA